MNNVLYDTNNKNRVIHVVGKEQYAFQILLFEQLKINVIFETIIFVNCNNY